MLEIGGKTFAEDSLRFTLGNYAQAMEARDLFQASAEKKDRKGEAKGVVDLLKLVLGLSDEELKRVGAREGMEAFLAILKENAPSPKDAPASTPAPKPDAGE
jgi:hypothetical protein